MYCAGDILVYPDFDIVFACSFDRAFETDVFLVEFEFVLSLKGFADVFSCDGAEDSSVFAALYFNDDFDFLQLGSHDDCFIGSDLALEFLGFLALCCCIEVLACAFYAEAFADEYVAAVAVGDFNDVSLFPIFLTSCSNTTFILFPPLFVFRPPG